MLHAQSSKGSFSLASINSEWLKENHSFTLYDGQRKVGKISIVGNSSVTPEFYSPSHKNIVNSIYNDVVGMILSSSIKS